MKNNTLLVLLLTITGCSFNNSKSNDNSLNVPSNSLSSSDTKEIVKITFYQYDCDIFVKEGNKVVIELYDELMSTTVRKFEKGYYLSYSELDEIRMSLNNVIPELGGDGYYTFTPFYYNKYLLDKGGVLRDVYLNEDLVVYYGIYG